MTDQPTPDVDPLAPYDAVMLLSYGGPNGPDDVLPFMRNATAGRGVPDSRLLEVSGHYQRFGGVSPINARNRELLAALRAELAARGSRVPVGWGNRNWHPFVTEGLQELADDGARRILVLTTSAYASYSGCRQYREDLAKALGELGRPDLQVDKTRPSYNTPGMLQANTEAIVDAYRKLAGRGVPADQVRLVLVTHSIPVGMASQSAPDDAERANFLNAQSDAQESSVQEVAALEPGVAADLSTEIDYVAQHQAFARILLPAVGQALALPTAPEADLVYCSRSGPPQARWLEPDVNNHLENLAAGTATRPDGTPIPRPQGVIVAPIGFVSDHMEVVFDLDTEAAETAQELGLAYERAATAGTHPAYVSALVDLLQERAAVARGEDVTPPSTTGTGPFHTVCPESCCRPGVSAHPHARPHTAKD